MQRQQRSIYNDKCDVNDDGVGMKVEDLDAFWERMWNKDVKKNYILLQNQSLLMFTFVLKVNVRVVQGGVFLQTQYQTGWL